MHKKSALRIILPIILLLAVGGTLWAVLASRSSSANGMTVSGTIEAQSAVLSPEIGGRVAIIHVNEGDTVVAGDALFSIDDTLLQAQRKVAEAALMNARDAQQTALAAQGSAQSALDLALATARLESAAVRAADWSAPKPAGYTLPDGSFTPTELIHAAQSELAAAEANRQSLSDALSALLADPASADFSAAETALLGHKFAFQAAADVLNKASLSGNADLKSDAQTAYDDAQAALEDAQTAYDVLQNDDAAQQVLAARRLVVLADERVQAAAARLAALQTGENSLKVLAARAALEQAGSAAAQSGGAVTQAQANLDLLDVQISKLTVTAPADGTILSRSIELGEVVSPGAPALQLGRLDPLTITVYVPESQLGSLALEQQAALAVDSFPGETFTAVVIHIADQAEFTPRNVQTVEGRKSTVFAVKLQVANPDGKLKPGMPADVTFK